MSDYREHLDEMIDEIIASSPSDDKFTLKLKHLASRRLKNIDNPNFIHNLLRDTMDVLAQDQEVYKGTSVLFNDLIGAHAEDGERLYSHLFAGKVHEANRKTVEFMAIALLTTLKYVKTKDDDRNRD